MINIAILGYGVVGSGVAEVCEMNSKAINRRAGKQINIKRILDLRDFPGDPYENKITHKADDIINDDEILVVVETIGGVGFAYEITKRALLAGKHVVTSNKELVAQHGPELMQIARQKNISYLFEASVGGGIPIIRPFHKCLAANEIDSITGILNGTTNYILTRMDESGKDFATALQEAQELGYAEQDPSADVDGIDACRKLAILSSIAYGAYIDSEKIYTEGIRKITVRDMAYAHKLDCKIKLIASLYRNEDDLAELIVAPMLLDSSSPIAVAKGVFNAIMVHGNALGEAMFYGQGAGKLPTASAVVADVIECVMHINKQPHPIEWIVSERELVKPHAACTLEVLLRVKKAADQALVTDLCKEFGLEPLEAIFADERAYRVGINKEKPLSEEQWQQILEQLGDNVSGWLRFGRSK